MIDVAFLGQAMWEVCQAQLLAYGRDEKGFWAEFDKSLDSQLFSVIGERIAALLTAPYRITEMTAPSLKGLLRHHGQYAMARQIEGKGLFSVYQSEGYAMIAEGEAPGAILLTAWKGGKIYGLSGPDKEFVRERQKAVRAGAKRDHRKRADLFAEIEGELVWLPEAVSRRNAVKRAVEGLYRDLGMVEVRGSALEAILGRLGVGVWGWKESPGERGIMADGEGTQFYAKFENRKEIDSYLQSVQKMSKMFGLNAEVFFDEEIASVIARDGYGEEVEIARIEKGDGVWKGSLLESVEAIVALQVENG